jgi:GAF domain-containing protein
MTEDDSTPLLERYQRLTEISRELASTLDLDVLLKRIVHAAADLSNAEAASILLYDEVHQQLQFEAATKFKRADDARSGGASYEQPGRVDCFEPRAYHHR